MQRCATRPMGAPEQEMRVQPVLEGAFESIMARKFGADSSTISAMPPKVKRKGMLTVGCGT